MNTSFPRSLPLLIPFLLVLVVLFFSASSLSATESGMTFHAETMIGIVSNRARMIQISIVCVVFGCSLLWWKR